MAGSMPWPPDPDEAPVEAAREALGGLFNIVQVAQEWGVKRISLASTIGVYGGLSNAGALTEDLPVLLTAPHVIPTFKKISELLGHHLAASTGLEIINLRISGAWGPLGHLPNFAFPAPQFVHAAATGEPLDLSGVAGRLKADDGLDLCYVYDLGRATALLQTAETLTHETYNVAAGRMTTNAEVIAAIKSVVPDFELELEPGSSAPPAYLDITRLHEATGYLPQWDLERSVAHYIAYFRDGNER
jgi:UDP-glucose 4-epimerase